MADILFTIMMRKPLVIVYYWKLVFLLSMFMLFLEDNLILNFFEGLASCTRAMKHEFSHTFSAPFGVAYIAVIVNVEPTNDLILGFLIFEIVLCWDCLFDAGFLYDRQWMVVNADSGRLIAMARAPKLALVQPFLPAAALRGERMPDDAVLGAN